MQHNRISLVHAVRQLRPVLSSQVSKGDRSAYTTALLAFWFFQQQQLSVNRAGYSARAY